MKRKKSEGGALRGRGWAGGGNKFMVSFGGIQKNREWENKWQSGLDLQVARRKIRCCWKRLNGTTRIVGNWFSPKKWNFSEWAATKQVVPVYRCTPCSGQSLRLNGGRRHFWREAKYWSLWTSKRFWSYKALLKSFTTQGLLKTCQNSWKSHEWQIWDFHNAEKYV